MSRTKDLDLFDLYLEIEWSFHQRQCERREKKTQQKDTIDDNRIQDELPADGINNQAPLARSAEVNERDILMGEYMMPPIVENQFNIVYPSYRHNNFQLRLEVMNLFSDNLPFYGMTNENLHYHISRFDEYCRNFKYYSVNEKALKMMLFSHTLKDKAREWLDSLPPRNITTWTDLI
ncbi:Retrotrans gag domain-containing protein [Abeliophyllum distichum]|uniref:Retrotrans gag domain-containing protein n=1 Tax=Abeliophyllum distichum TaxID=126358 RepID=A0ABD1UNS8_9LAMI